MKANVGALVYETLRSHGVTCIFGMEDPIHLFHAVDRDATRIVTVRDERHGAIMAHGFAQASGRPGICTATFGPGATNLITGLLESLRSSVPVIALVQDQSSANKNRNASSDLDHVAALAPYTKAVYRIDLPQQACDIVRAAFRIACSGRPGPVVILCPTDVMAAEGEGEPFADPACTAVPTHRSRPAADAVTAAAALLAAAERPLIVAGGGSVISGAFEEVRWLAERFSAPVVTTLTGRGAIADSHPLSAGPLGNQSGGRLGRGSVANAVAADADVVVLLGTRTGQLCYANWTLPNRAARFIHLDVDPAEIGRNFPTEVAMVGDVRDGLRDLRRHCEDAGIGRAPRGERERVQGLLGEWMALNEALVHSDARPVRPERLIGEIAGIVGDDTLVVADASYSTAWALSHIDVPRAGRFVLSPRGTGSIGWGLPAAIGARLGDPSRPVVCITGDGGFGYVMNELETAARYGVPVLVVVMNNGTLGYQRHWEQRALGRYMECDFLDVDYAEVARALRCGGERVQDPGEIAAALRRGLAAGGPYVVDVVTDPAIAGPVVGIESEIRAGDSH